MLCVVVKVIFSTSDVLFGQTCEAYIHKQWLHSIWRYRQGFETESFDSLSHLHEMKCYYCYCCTIPYVISQKDWCKILSLNTKVFCERGFCNV